MVDEELAFMPATDLLKLIRTKKVSPVELTELYYSRIDRLDSKLNSYLLLTRDHAMKSAKVAEAAVIRGDELGALHGLPVSIKDTQMTKGFRSSIGSAVFKNNVPGRDSAVVERILNAGAIMLGKTNLSEFGLVGSCENMLGDHGRNPWDTNCTPGGSSGGAASAMAASLCALSQGGDAGGSIRIPASFCGIYGIKPTQGRISGYTGLEGPAIVNFFGQAGPLSRTVRDSALMLEVLAGHDRRDPTSLRETPPAFTAAVTKDIRGLRVAWSPDYGFAAVDPEVLDITAKAAQTFEQLGCHLEDSSLVMESPYDAYGPIYEAGAYNAYAGYLNTHGDQMTYFVKDFIKWGSNISTGDYARALGLIEELRAQMTDVFEKYDLLLSPTTASTAIPVGEFPEEIAGRPVYPHKYFSFHPFTYPINAIGHPAASIPAGFSSDGMPVGLHIVGRKGDEETVIAASAAFERENPWIQYRPPVS